MEKLLPIALDAVVLECADVNALADFYCRLLGWEKRYDEGDEWVDICAASGGVKSRSREMRSMCRLSGRTNPARSSRWRILISSSRISGRWRWPRLMRFPAAR